CLENCSTGEGILPSSAYANAEDNANTPAISKATTVRRSSPALKGDNAIIMCLPDTDFLFAEIAEILAQVSGRGLHAVSGLARRCFFFQCGGCAWPGVGPTDLTTAIMCSCLSDSAPSCFEALL